MEDKRKKAIDAHTEAFTTGLMTGFVNGDGTITDYEEQKLKQVLDTIYSIMDISRNNKKFNDMKEYLSKKEA